jgi:hypothetical protein
MNYVFYETGDNAFFKHIAEVFSPIFMWFVLINIFNEVLQPPRGMVDKSRNGRLQIKTNYYKTILKPLNCNLFPAIPIRCGNRKCKKSHKIVLASDQVAVFEAAMIESKKSLAENKAYIMDNKVRCNMQEVLENFRIGAIVAKNVFEHIIINEKGYPGAHSIKYKQNNSTAYKQKYIEQAQKIMDRPDTENCVYVRAGTNSDYTIFEASIRSQGVTVTPCDEFQSL